MKLLAELTEKSVGLGERRERLDGSYVLRKSARAILLNDNGEMAVQYVASQKVHKLPGGGIKIGETIEEALRRELREEVGCDVSIERFLGLVIEYRETKLQISYGYVARIEGALGAVALDAAELLAGHMTQWMKPETCLQNLRAEQVFTTRFAFSLARELVFLEEYLQSK